MKPNFPRNGGKKKNYSDKVTKKKTKDTQQQQKQKQWGENRKKKENRVETVLLVANQPFFTLRNNLWKAFIYIVSQREVSRSPVATSSEPSDQTGSMII